MRWLFTNIVCLIFLLPGSSLKADKSAFHIIHYNTQYNLPTDLIKDVNKDDKGGYFLATDVGCFWFLARENMKLQTPPGKSDYFKHFLRTKDGTLFVVSDDGLYRIDYKSEGPYLDLLYGKGRSINDTLPYYYKNLYEDNFGTIWIADNRNIFNLDNWHLKKYKMDAKNETTSYERSFHFMEFPKNHFAAISQQGYLYSYDRTNDRFVEAKQVVADEVHAIIQFDANSYLLGSRRGLLLLEWNNGYTVSEVSNGGGIVFSAFGKISDKTFVGGSWSQGVHVLDFSSGQLEIMEIEDFPYNGIQNLFASENTDFIASTNSGIIILRNKHFVPAFDEVNSGIINYLTADKDGQLLFTRNNVIYRTFADRTRLQVLFQNPEYAPDMVIHHSSDSVLIGTLDGRLLLFYKGRLKEEIETGTQQVTNILKDRYGFYWIQRYNELYQLDFSKRRLIDQTRNVPAHVTVGAIALDKDSLLAVGTNEWHQPILHYNYGSHSFDPVQTRYISDTIAGYNCLKLLVLKDSMVIGSTTGAYVFKQNILQKLDIGEFSNEEIHAMAMDAYGALWFSSSKGLVKWEDGEWFLFTDLNGIPSKTIIRNGILVDRNQEVWIGTNNGGAKFNNKLRNVEMNPPIVLSPKLNRFIYRNHEKIVLTAEDYYVLKLYSSYLPQYANRFRYKLIYDENEKTEWLDVPNDDQLFLNIEKPGQCQLQISAKNSGLSRWSDPLIIDLKVVLPIYKRWYVILPFMLFLIGVVIIIIYFDRKKSVQEKAKLEQLVSQRTHELNLSNNELKALNKTKDRFLSIIAHDLRNPFHTLMGISSLLIQSYDELSHDERKKMIKNIQKASELTYGLLMNLMVWTRVQTGSFEVRPTRFHLNELIIQNVELASESAAFKKITFENSLEVIEIVADEDMISTVLRNLISNAIKFSPHNTVLKIKMWKEKYMVNVSVLDQGRGMTPEELSIIRKADANYSTEGTDNEKGTGFGLSICKEFIRLNKGNLEIESSIGKGSTFTFSLPLTD